MIWGDDIGRANLSRYSRGLMGYPTPNIDELPMRARFSPNPRGANLPGRALILHHRAKRLPDRHEQGRDTRHERRVTKEDPTIAECSSRGIRHRPVQQDHLGDLNKFLPTAHGFDEFFGNLYHLNAEENGETPTTPRKRNFRCCARINSRVASSTPGRPTRTPARTTSWHGPVGKQRIEDTGPYQKADGDHRRRNHLRLHRFHLAPHEADTPFFVWMNITHMHFRTDTKTDSLGQAGRWQSPYHDTWSTTTATSASCWIWTNFSISHGDSTIVIYFNHRGPKARSWPDGASTAFRRVKNTNGEG